MHFFILISLFLFHFLYGRISAIQIPCSCTNCSDWVLSSTNLSDDYRYRPTIANGFVGTTIHNPDLHVNGFYNGYTSASTRVLVPNRINLQVNFTGTTTYSLNMQTGTFEELIVNNSLGLTISIISYANMANKQFLVVEVTLKSANPVANDINIGVQSWTAMNTGDMNITTDADNSDYHIFQAVPHTLETENVSAPNLTIFSTNLPSNGLLTLPKNQSVRKYVFYSSITVNNYTLAQRLFDLGKNLSTSDANRTTGFMSIHAAEWTRIWQNRFDINENCDLAGKVHAAYYYIYSSLPMGMAYEDDGWPYFGISPGSLADEDGKGHNYKGRIFWDQDLWMLPGVLPFHPEVVKRVIRDTRVRNLEPAMYNAKRFGWSGAMYPWELAYSGYETSPWPLATWTEIHVTGDSAFTTMQYLQLTNDTDFAQVYYESSLQIATYYSSLLQPTHNFLGIYNIMGPDEYHYPVNNSIYENSIAKIALGLPDWLKNTFGVNGPSPNSTWSQTIEKIYIPFDANKQYHPEYDGYAYADVILLGYPLLVTMDLAVRQNDLIIYQNLTDSAGPAMTWAMHSIGWLEFGDEDQAKNMFVKSFDYIQAPFNIWTEFIKGNSQIGCINFLTGMGGFMQNILQGYLGLRIYADRLQFTPYLIPDSGSYSAIGIVYQGMTFDFNVTSENVQVVLTNPPKNGCVLIDENGKEYALKKGIVFAGTIKKSRRITCQPTKTSDAWRRQSSYLVIVIILSNFFINK